MTPREERLASVISDAIDDFNARDSLTVIEILTALEDIRYALTEALMNPRRVRRALRKRRKKPR